MNTRTRFHRRE